MPGSTSFSRIPSFRISTWKFGLWATIAGGILIVISIAYFSLVLWESRNPERLIYPGSDAKPGPNRETLTALLDAAEASGGHIVYPWRDPGSVMALNEVALLRSFTTTGGVGVPVSGVGAKNFVRLIVPSIRIDAGVKELEVVNLNDSRAYKTPRHTIGHIPTSAKPGEIGNGWYFGHLESLIRGEGNVFANLVDIPDLLHNGQKVYVVGETQNHQFLYVVLSTDLVHEDQFRIYESDDSRISLVTCFPKLRYDHRLIITASLVGIRNLLSGPLIF